MANALTLEVEVGSTRVLCEIRHRKVCAFVKNIMKMRECTNKIGASSNPAIITNFTFFVTSHQL